MENYLMSSPRNQHDYEYQNLDINLEYYDLKDQNELTEFQNYYDTFHNENMYQENEEYFKYQSMKNVSLTDNMNLTRHHQNLSISSAQDFLPKKVPNSTSIESIPPLTSSISNQSLASPNHFRKTSENIQNFNTTDLHQIVEPVTDINHLQFTNDNSPQLSTMGPPSTTSSNSIQTTTHNDNNSTRSTPNPDSAQFQLQHIQPISEPVQPPQQSALTQANQNLSTPRRVSRKKSLSIGAYSLSTPLRSSTSPSTASSNSANITKISKTPYRHSRTLSRTIMDKNANNNLNPFYNTPNSFVSPKYSDYSFDNEDFQTPMQPNDNNASFASVPAYNLQYTSPQFNHKVSPVLKRQNTLDSIKIEDQEDDAFKQLKRAKSFTNFKPSASTPTNEFYQSQPSSFNQNNNQLAIQHVPNQRLPNQQIPNERVPDQQIPNEEVPNLQMANTHYEAQMVQSNQLSNIQLLQSQFNNLKSYPASVNLASIANDKSAGLLPPMTSLSAPASASGSMSAPSSIAPISAPPSAGPQTQHASFPIVQPPHQVSEESLKIAKEINPSFIPDLPIKINEKAANYSDPKKKHACPLCYARFQRPEHVKRHMKSHSSEKPFECDQPNCTKRFNRKDNLKAHLKKIHSIVGK